MGEREADDIRLAVLEEKLVNMTEVISKLDVTIEKLSDLSVSVSRMLAVHEEKLDFVRETAAETAKDIQDLETRFIEKLDKTKTRVASIERRVWIGIGIFSVVAFVFTTPVGTNIFHHDSKPAIMRSVK
jgi:hypothetical protein